jgi:hypothetical protein
MRIGVKQIKTAVVVLFACFFMSIYIRIYDNETLYVKKGDFYV